MSARFAPVVLAALLVSNLSVSTRAGEDWPQWRGPHATGASAAKDLPDQLDLKANLLWTTTLPGASNATPAVAGDRVFVSTLDTPSKKLIAMCLDRKDGHILWQKDVGIGFNVSDRNNMASPSPVTDGKNVWFYYGTGDLAAFDVSGKELWSHNIQKEHGAFSIQWIYASSPLLYHDKIYVQVLHKSADSYLLAFDAASGKEFWKEQRPNEARDESKESYATPEPSDASGKPQIVLVGGDCVTGHDPETGKEIWRCGGWNPEKINHWRIVGSAVTVGNLIIACPPKGGKVFAIKPGEGDITATGVAWKSKEASTDVCVPLVYDDNLYVLNGDKKALHCIDPKTGETKWTHTLGGHAVFRGSPTGADGKIYCMNESGDVWVVSAKEPKTISQASFGDGPTRASIVVVDGQAIVRTGTKVYGFGKK